jgi:hypothetical protein
MDMELLLQDFQYIWRDEGKKGGPEVDVLMPQLNIVAG